MKKTNPATKNFIYNLNRYLLIFASPTTIKSFIGDSTNNHRTPTVRQCVRYLRQLGIPELSSKLNNTYKFLQEQGYFDKVRKSKNRVDALDINEYFVVLEKYLAKADPSVKGQFTKIVKN